MSRYKDISGQKFGRLLALWPAGRSGKEEKIFWSCQCDCGNIVLATCDSLRRKNTKSCGCYRDELIVTLSRTHGQSSQKHKASEYRTWINMKTRCYNDKYPEYFLYGGRNIALCDRWRDSFENFYADMGPKPEPKRKYSIDRINNNGNYEPGNCRWATSREQNNNRRSNRLITYQNRTQTLSQWAEELNIDIKILWNYLYRSHKSLESIILSL